MPSPEKDVWVGAVVRSGIDARVWVAVLPGVDTATGAMQASTSLRKCRAHVAQHVAHDLGSAVSWRRDDNGDWDAYVLPPGRDGGVS